MGKDSREILILTAYNVPQDTPAGDDTLHAQQTSQYLINKIDNPHPRKLFIKDLLTLIKEAVNDDQDIILMGDFNEIIGEDPRMMAQVLTAGRLTDIHANCHGNKTNIATYIQGKRRVDYCFASPRLMDHVLRCGFETFHALIGSDHRGYYVDLLMQGLFDRRLPAILSPAERCIQSSHPRLVKRYIEKLHKYFVDHNIIQKAKEAKNYYDAEKIEKLDKLITVGMLHAESKYRNCLRLPWSKEINKVMTKFNILKIHLSSLRNNIDCSKQIEKKEQLLAKKIVLPLTITDTVIALKQALAGGQDLLERISIKKNHATGRLGGSVYSQLSQYGYCKSNKDL